ncbi:hypothetical protein ACFQ7N_38305 [Streptomyces niveus]|uniref:hypothetical protein n=1 Tax=Streptomyces niveus TaxID=193462 RepID=UPI0036973DDB
MLDEHTQIAPWGTVTPHFWQAGHPAPPAGQGTTPAADPTAARDEPHGGHDEQPREYRDQIAVVVGALDTPDNKVRLDSAAVLAEQLDQEFTQRYGPRHPHTINLRELRGWLAMVSGRPALAARWYLHTTALQVQVRGTGHQATRRSVQRTVHIWLSIPDARESLTIGRELLAMLTAVTGEDSSLSCKVRKRLKSMETPSR